MYKNRSYKGKWGHIEGVSNKGMSRLRYFAETVKRSALSCKIVGSKLDYLEFLCQQIHFETNLILMLIRFLWILNWPYWSFFIIFKPLKLKRTSVNKIPDFTIGEAIIFQSRAGTAPFSYIHPRLWECWTFLNSYDF